MPEPGWRRRFPGELRAHFEAEDSLGAGGMGEVFLARDRALGRRVAIKLVHADLASRHRARFAREAAALARLQHPNVVSVYDFGETAQGPYLVMELLSGSDLEALPEGAEPLAVALEVARGLEAIHDAGLVHRDLKPSNVLRTAEGRVVIVDFGLAFDPDRTRLTAEGRMVGTVAYMAPEAFRGAEPTPAFDWYAWGMTLYRLLEGRCAYGLHHLFALPRGERLPEPSFERVPPDSRMADLLRRALAEDPARRVGSRQEIVDLLEGRAPAEVRGAPPASASPLSEANLSAPAEPRRSTRISWILSGERFVPWPGGRRGAALSGLLLGALALGWSGALRPVGPRLVSPIAGDAPGPRPPPMEGFADELDAALREAERRRVDLWGALLPADAPPGEGAAVLDPDPARWAVLLRRVEPLRRVHEWLERGGRLESLSPAGEAALRRADARLEERGMRPPPFGPFLDLRPAARPVPRPALLGAPPLRAAGMPEELSGWLASAALALEEAHAWARDRDAAFREALAAGIRPTGFPEGPWSDRERFVRADLFQFVRATSALPEHRRALRPWLAPGVAALLRATRAAALSIQEEPATRERAALLLLTPLGGERSVLFYSSFLWTPVGVLTAGTPRTPAGWALRAQLEYLRRLGRTRMGAPRPADLAQAEREALTRALEDVGEPVGVAAARRQGFMLLQALELEAGEGDAGGLLGVLRQAASAAEVLDPSHRKQLVRRGRAAVVGVLEDDPGARELSARSLEALEGRPARDP